jgi:hypothetical protein
MENGVVPRAQRGRERRERRRSERLRCDKRDGESETLDAHARGGRIHSGLSPRSLEHFTYVRGLQHYALLLDTS